MAPALQTSRTWHPPSAPIYSRFTDQTAPRTPLVAAAEGGFLYGVKRLLERLACVDPEALVLAATNGHAGVCSALLIAMGSNAEARDAAQRALLAAIQYGHMTTAVCVLNHAVADGAALRAVCALTGAKAAELMSAVCKVRPKMISALSRGTLPELRVHEWWECWCCRLGHPSTKQMMMATRAPHVSMILTPQMRVGPLVVTVGFV